MTDFLSGFRAPIFSVTFDASLASQGPSELPYSALIIGQRTAAAAALPGAPAANTLHRVTSVSDAINLGGRGSMLHRQAIGWYANNSQTETWIGLLDDDGAGVAATGSITVSGPATADGTIALYLGGVRYTVGVVSGDSADDIAAAINTMITTQALDAPVTSTVLGAVVTTTFRHKGEVGNSFDCRHSANDGEALPAGVGLVIVQTTGGTSNPPLTGLIAAMGDQWWQFLVHPYTDATALTDLENELRNRDGATRMIDGVAFTSASGSVGTMAALGNSRNSQHSVILSQPGQNPLTPPMEFAAEVAGLVALSVPAQQNRPLHRMTLTNAVSPAEGDLFTLQERNQLLFDGIATSATVVSTVQTEGVITTYQLNASAVPDTAYLYAETLFTLQYLRFSWRAFMASKYPRALLVQDGRQLPAGKQVMSPSIGRAATISWFIAMEDLLLVQDRRQFKKDLVVEIDSINPRQLNFTLPPNLVKQLVTASAVVQFR